MKKILIPVVALAAMFNLSAEVVADTAAAPAKKNSCLRRR
jgi:hypothetical protein